MMHLPFIFPGTLLDAVIRPDPRGYEQLDSATRFRLNLRTLTKFLHTSAFLRLLLYWMIWLLSGLHIVWYYDARGVTLLLPVLSSFVWLYPCLMAARKRGLSELLHPLWG